MKKLSALLLLGSILVSAAACSVLPSESDGQCVGVATACGFRPVSGGPDTCAFQAGCVSRDVSNPGEFGTYVCQGDAKACDSFDDADACGKQDGCHWEE